MVLGHKSNKFKWSNILKENLPLCLKGSYLKNIGNIVKTMVKEKFEWKKKLLHLRNKKIYNLSKSGKIGSEFISNYLKSNRFN